MGRGGETREEVVRPKNSRGNKQEVGSWGSHGWRDERPRHIKQHNMERLVKYYDCALHRA